MEGGFPEVWDLKDPVRKIEYLMDQQIRKVVYEDLLYLARYRKPENVLRFFVYLLTRPGIELNSPKACNEIGIDRRAFDEYLRLLELTDLIVRVQKFSHQPRRVRRGNFKSYPIDMALRNAALTNWEFPHGAALGYLAENLVIRELGVWPEKIEISYYREKNREIDFVFTYLSDQHLPIEVKSSNRSEQESQLKFFMQKYDLKLGVIITRENICRFHEQPENILCLPLRYFLLGSS